MGDVGVTLGSCWGHFEVTLGSLWGHFGVTVGSRWGHFGISLGSRSDHFWDHFGVTFAPAEMKIAKNKLATGPNSGMKNNSFRRTKTAESKQGIALLSALRPLRGRWLGDLAKAAFARWNATWNV